MLADNARVRLDAIGGCRNKRRIRTTLKNRNKIRTRRYRYRLQTRRDKKLTRRGFLKSFRQGQSACHNMIYMMRNDLPEYSKNPAAEKAFRDGLKQTIRDNI